MNLKLISSIGVLLVAFLNSNVFANEVGDKIAVLSPKAEPIHTSVSKDGSSITRSWPCEGFVHPKMINIVYKELTSISEEINVIPPNPSLCLWRVGNWRVGNLDHKIFEIQMFINQSSMESCILKDKCIDVRSMYFKGKGFRHYMVTNSTRKIAQHTCISPDGSVISLNSGC